MNNLPAPLSCVALSSERSRIAPLSCVALSSERSRIALPLTLALALSLVRPSSAQDHAAFDPRTASPRDLLAAATHYGVAGADRTAKEAALAELYARGSNGFDIVIAHVHLENSMIFVLAEQIMERFDAKDTAPVLARYLDATNPVTRRTAAFFLGFDPTPEYAGRVAALLDHEKTRGAAIRTLGKWKSTNHLEAIVGFLGSTNERIRVAAANALRDIGDPRAAPALTAALGDPYFTVRQCAQRALVALGPPAVPTLAGALDAAPPIAERPIVQALGEIGGDAAFRALEGRADRGDPWLRVDLESARRAHPAAPPP